MSVQYKMFKATFKSWDDLFAEAASYASTIPRDRLISISHSEDKSYGVVTVWYLA